MHSLDLLVRAVKASRAPAGVATRVIAIDGPGGSGKSTLAAHLAEELQAAVIHTDDFAGWNDPINWWPALLDRALRPLAAGQPARYESSMRIDGQQPSPVTIEPGGTVVLEGVTASRRAFRPYLAYSIWLETDPALRLQRGIDRDGEAAREQWKRWMAAEDAYIAAEQPAAYVDVVVRGDRDLWR